MGLWPFGKAKADVETASRVVVLRARDAVPMRAKVTVKFAEPQTQEAADEMAETCAELLRNLVREAPAAAGVLGYEPAIAAEVADRLGKEAAALRSLEIAGLHIIGDPGHVQKTVGSALDLPAWLRSKGSSPADGRGGERLTPIHPVERLTPIHPVERLTPVQPVERSTPAQPVERSSAVHPPPALPAERGSFASTAVSPSLGAAARPAAPAPPVEPAHATPHSSSVVSPHSRPGPPPSSSAVIPPSRPSAPDSRHAMIPPSRPSSPQSSSAAIPPSRPSAPDSRHAMLPPSRPGPPRSESSSQLAAVRPGPQRSASSSQLAAVRPPDEPSASSRSYSHLSPPSSKSAPPSSAAASSRRSSSRPPPPAGIHARRRIVAARFPLPAGAGPYEVARGLTPLFRDTAGRVLVAFLRAYDLTVIRRVPFDAIEGDILSSLTAPSDGAAGTYAASHAPEITRWREAFGAATMTKLQREANLASLALCHETMSAEGVSLSSVDGVVEGLAGSAFGDPDMLMELGRYLFPAHETMSAETLANMIDIAGEQMPPGLEEALAPLFVSLRTEVTAAALIAKDAMAGAPPL